MEDQEDFLENLAKKPDGNETDGDRCRNRIILFYVKKPLLHIFSLCSSVQMEEYLHYTLAPVSLTIISQLIKKKYMEIQFMPRLCAIQTIMHYHIFVLLKFIFN